MPVTVKGVMPFGAATLSHSVRDRTGLVRQHEPAVPSLVPEPGHFFASEL
jgi:hypothetical protein